ncbi:MAG TPA: PilZ domain-containing protein [Pyrinomonadaceae bacterium]
MPSETESVLDHLEPEQGPEQKRAFRPAPAVPKVSVVVKGKDAKFRAWSDTASLTSLSSSGAGLFLGRGCPVGCLISLMLPMPAHLRRYDHDKRFYRVWGLVQHCYQAGGSDEGGFHVGVALIGRDAPESYSRNPAQCYRVEGMDRNGLWKVEELETTFRKRGDVRYWNSIETLLYQLDDELRSVAAEQTVTENISESGAAVFSDLRISVGDRIKFQTSDPPFSSLCVVCHRRIGVDNRTRIHLQFVENAFPVLEVEDPIEEDGEH